MIETTEPIRKIIHIDMDCFYAAVEMRDDPSLQAHPIAVGGFANQRGVICTCNYQARKYGIHSAMSTSQALKQCPSLIVLPVNMAKYEDVSQNIRQIFFDYTSLVEPISLDEAYLDVSQVTMHQGSATRIAEEIRTRIYDEHALTASAGVAPNKLLAKIASDWRKPNGLFVITPNEITAFMKPLPVEKLLGVGAVTASKLHQLGIVNCQQLEKIPLIRLIELFGAYGQQLHRLCRGIDDRSVNPHRIAKSVRVEHTFAEDLQTIDACCVAIDALILQLQPRLEKKNDKPKTQFLKIKFSDFTQTTVERQFTALSSDAFYPLLKTGYYRKQLPIRLLGIGIRFQPPLENHFHAVQTELPI